MQQASSTFKPTLMLMSGRALAFAVTFFVPAILTRIFNQTEFGTYKQFALITSTLYIFGQLGFAECLFYFLPANPDKGGKYAFNSLVMLGAVGVFFSAVLVTNASRVAGWLSNPDLATYVPLAGLYLVFMLMGAVLEITMITRKNFRLATVTYVLSDVLRAAFLVLPAMITRNLEWTLIGAVTFCGLRVAGNLAYFMAEFGRDIRFDTAVLREQLAYALPFASAVCLQIIQQNYHQYAVSWHFNAATFAIYSVGCLQIPLVDFMATPASNVMMVAMGEELREGRYERLLAVWHETTRRLAFVFFPLVGLLVSNAYPLIVMLFTTSYAASVPIFMVWSLSILFVVFQTDGVLRTFAENRWLFIVNLTRLVMVVAMMGWFIATFNLMGAVLVTLSGIVLAKAMALARMKTLLRASLAQLMPWRSLGSILTISMVSAIPSVIVNAKLNVAPVILLPISGLAYMGTYSVLVLAFGLLTEGEKTFMKRSFYVWNRRSAEPRREAGI
ncbi:MAG TPA: lipopolysaccharide biosynthesis protein [Terriglobia bacterium]|nr:lipopolysaccharide biosynthesis protein [Terriglobia bacterium]